MSRGSFPGGGSFVGRPPAPARRPPCPWWGESLEQASEPAEHDEPTHPAQRHVPCAPPVGASLAMSRLALCAPREVGRHRDLHSFPTRRSSDLGGRRII